MESSTIALLISGAGLFVIVLDRALGGSWKLSGKLAEMEKGLSEAILASTKDVEEKQERATRDFGETASALREKIRELELFVRDKYIEKNDFVIQMQHHNEMITMNFSAITARLDRMEKKLDQKT
jgi:hypothetical protein